MRENFEFAGTRLLMSLFAFNVGIKASQVVVLAFMLPVLALLRRHVLPRRVAPIFLSAPIADTA